jgi:hypothetical protein
MNLYINFRLIMVVIPTILVTSHVTITILWEVIPRLRKMMLISGKILIKC